MKSFKTAVVACAIALSSVAQAATFSTFYVFGDSLVDAGNVSILTGGTNPSPAVGYFQGRFTDGYNYPDLLSIAAFGAPTKASLAGGNNFAWGGARVVANAGPIPDLNAQLGAYAARAANIADPNALYLLNFGGNDVFAIDSGDTGGLSATDYGNLVVSQYVDGVSYLNGIGARNILITGIPNVTSAAGVALEQQLQVALNGVILAPNTNLYRFSYINFFSTILSDPGSVGLPALNIATPCLAAQTPSPNIDCTGYFSFDGIHPTAAVQAAAAREINRQFNLVAVPEPTSWMLLIAGFAITGIALRRRRSGVIYARV